MSERDSVRQLRDRIRDAAKEHNVPTAQAAGLVWHEEGGEQNTYNDRVWDRALRVLGVDLEAEAER
jgi:hypothetical protein